MTDRVGEGQAGPSALHRKIGFCKAPAKCLGCQAIQAFSETALEKVTKFAELLKDQRKVAETALAEARSHATTEWGEAQARDAAAALAKLATMTKERDALLYTSDKQAGAWKERALHAEMQLESSRAEATKAERERACAAVCHDCATGKPVFLGSHRGPNWELGWWHGERLKYPWQCDAAKVRAIDAAIRAPQPPEPEKCNGNETGYHTCGLPVGGHPSPSSPPPPSRKCEECDEPVVALGLCKEHVKEHLPTPPSAIQERYARMKDSLWFKNMHDGKSLGETLPLPDEAPPPSEEPRPAPGIVAMLYVYGYHGGEANNYGLTGCPPDCPDCAYAAVPSPEPPREEPRE